MPICPRGDFSRFGPKWRTLAATSSRRPKFSSMYISLSSESRASCSRIRLQSCVPHDVVSPRGLGCPSFYAASPRDDGRNYLRSLLTRPRHIYMARHSSPRLRRWGWVSVLERVGVRARVRLRGGCWGQASSRQGESVRVREPIALGLVRVVGL